VKKERRERIDHELQRELARLISTELKDPRLGFTTVTGVEKSDDMQHAKVFVSIIRWRFSAGGAWACGALTLHAGAYVH
jgi:ribosome-binding factor A